MLSTSTKAVKHFDKWVPCCEGRVLALSNPQNLFRLDSEQHAVIVSNLYAELGTDYYAFKNVIPGDSYMLSQHPTTAS